MQVFEKDKAARTVQLTSLSAQLTSLTTLLNDQTALHEEEKAAQLQQMDEMRNAHLAEQSSLKKQLEQVRPLCCPPA